jgi:hypothetical protein
MRIVDTYPRRILNPAPVPLPDPERDARYEAEQRGKAMALMRLASRRDSLCLEVYEHMLGRGVPNAGPADYRRLEAERSAERKPNGFHRLTSEGWIRARAAAASWARKEGLHIPLGTGTHRDREAMTRCTCGWFAKGGNYTRSDRDALFGKLCNHLDEMGRLKQVVAPALQPMPSPDGGADE